jgi:hypothetical protein
MIGKQLSCSDQKVSGVPLYLRFTKKRAQPKPPPPPAKRMTDATGSSGLIRMNFCVTPDRESTFTSSYDGPAAGLAEGAVAQLVKRKREKVATDNIKTMLLSRNAFILFSLYIAIIKTYIV